MRFSDKSIPAALFKRKQAEIQAELDAAHESLTETDLRMKIDRRQIELALELTEDVRPLDENRARGAKALSLAPVSIYEQMAEIQGGRSNYEHPAWERIRKLYAQRFGDSQSSLNAPSASSSESGSS
jgi:hypothetical protein